MAQNKIILASSSSIRKKLLQSINIDPIVIVPNIEEIRLNKETPLNMAKRLAKAKAKAVFESIDPNTRKNKIILAVDSVIAVGSRVLEKSTTYEIMEKNIRLLSGRSHRCYTAFCIINESLNKEICKYTCTTVKFKKLSEQEIKLYISQPTHNSVYEAEGFAGRFIKSINGSISGLQGLPLCEVINCF